MLKLCIEVTHLLRGEWKVRFIPSFFNYMEFKHVKSEYVIEIAFSGLGNSLSLLLDEEIIATVRCIEFSEHWLTEHPKIVLAAIVEVQHVIEHLTGETNNSLNLSLWEVLPTLSQIEADLNDPP